MLLLCSAVTEAGDVVDTEIDGKDYGWRQATVDTFDLGAVGGMAARQTPLNQHYGNGPVNLYPSSDFDRVTAGGSLDPTALRRWVCWLAASICGSGPIARPWKSSEMMAK